ncbi:UNVERIFIED_CONTAM: hypothetical protein Slati_2688400 [Sesamum latifolium]|uniref:Uncharacterized protein n=1 Tax=Sesamum latifolium TaxID=2727402 RepID=A0AAW2W061_9LAMI
MAEGLWTWKKLLKLREKMMQGIEYPVGDGTTFKLWLDPWHPDGLLIQRFPNGPMITGLPMDFELQLVITAGEWSWPSARHMDIREIVSKLPTVHFGAPDSIIWKSSSGMFSTKDAYTLFSSSS